MRGELGRYDRACSRPGSGHLDLGRYRPFKLVNYPAETAMPWYMQWYVWGLIGGIIAPWLVFTRQLRAAFEGGTQRGLVVWSGVCLFTVPAMLAIVFLVSLVTSK